MPRVHLEISGRVQGVGFRWFVREHARRLGLAGWVRNRENGAVELAAEGEAAALERLSEAVRRGPPGSRVEEVRSVAGDTENVLPQPFAIHR